MGEKTINIGNVKMKIKKSADETAVESVDLVDIDVIDRTEGSISDLKLGNERSHFRTPIVEAADDSVLVTRSSPTCYWYFYGGRWWKLCT